MVEPTSSIVAEELLQKAKKPQEHKKNEFGEFQDEEEDIKYYHFTYALTYFWKTGKGLEFSCSTLL